MNLRYVTLVAMVVAGACATGEDDAEPAGQANISPELWRPFAPQETVAGKSLEEWAVCWRQWFYAQTDCVDANYGDTDGSSCRLYQDAESPVFFMGAGYEGTVRDRCIVPAGKPLVVPVGYFSNDNAGVTDALSDEQLEESVSQRHDSMYDMKLVADESLVADINEYAIGPVRFSYHVPAEPNYYSCNGTIGVADTTVDPAYLAGYFAILPAPKPGTHTIRSATVQTADGVPFLLEVTSTFEVESKP